MKIDLKFSHFEQIHKNGYNLDVVFLLLLIDEGDDVKTLCCEMPKMEALCQTIYRKGLVTKEYEITETGRDLIDFVKSDGTEDIVKKRKPKAKPVDFDLWWKTYPGTDTFRHKGKTFTGTRSLRQKKDDCRKKFEKILDEGQYTAAEMLKALEYEVLLKKENSIKNKTNKLSFMQNTYTYLHQRTFESFIELVREEVQIKESQDIEGGTDI